MRKQRATRPPMQRFRAMVREGEGCHVWTGKCTRNGYGQFYDERGRTVLAHRWLWEQVNGPIPDGVQLDHVRERGCASRACVNLAHLEIVTPAENIRRGDWLKVRQANNAALASCKHGHAWTPASTGYRKDGRRYCIPCMRERSRLWLRNARASGRYTRGGRVDMAGAI